MDPSTKPGPGEAPHDGWRNRDYDENEEATAPNRRWLQLAFVLLMLFGLIGLLWSGIVQPLLK
jgi:hypothetical protein